jgi:hypothetical protein
MEQLIIGIIGLLVGCFMAYFYKFFAQEVLDFLGWHGKYDNFGTNIVVFICGTGFIIIGLLLLIDFFKIIRMS